MPDLLSLLHFFTVAGHHMVLLQMNESKDRHRQPFLLYKCSKEPRLWGSPQFKIMISSFVKNWKIKISDFCQDQRGTREEKGERRTVMHFLCLQSICFLDTFLFHLWINIGFVIPKEEFVKGNLHKGIKLIFWMQIWKIWLVCEFFCSRWKWGHKTDSEDTLQTRDWAKNDKIWPAIQFCPWDFRRCPHPKDMSGSCLGHFQLNKAPTKAKFLPILERLMCAKD